MPNRLFRANRHVADQNFGPSVLEDLDDVDRFFVRGAESLVIRVVGHVRRDAIENRSHPHHDLGYGQSAVEYFGAVGSGENRFFHPLADLTAVDIKGGHDLDIAGPPIADLCVH